MKNDDEKSIRIGVLSDTHGRLDNRVFDLLKGVETIVHAGDVGATEILIDLEAIAPTHAVLGNTDQGGACWNLPPQLILPIGGVKIYATHGHFQSDPQRRIPGILEATREIAPDLVVVGHSHRPYLEVHEGITFLNPGSASQPRHGHPPSLAIVTLEQGSLGVRILDLDGNDLPTDSQI